MDWRLIDTAPKDGKAILAITKYETVVIVSWREGVDAGDQNRSKRHRWFVYESEDPFYSWSYEDGDLTHWMPLPEPPK